MILICNSVRRLQAIQACNFGLRNLRNPGLAAGGGARYSAMQETMIRAGSCRSGKTVELTKTGAKHPCITKAI
jgi:hypothetical protein